MSNWHARHRCPRFRVKILRNPKKSAKLQSGYSVRRTDDRHNSSTGGVYTYKSSNYITVFAEIKQRCSRIYGLGEWFLTRERINSTSFNTRDYVSYNCASRFCDTLICGYERLRVCTLLLNPASARCQEIVSRVIKLWLRYYDNVNDKRWNVWRW